MKRILLPVFVIALAVLLISAIGGKDKPADDAPRIVTVSEAAFSMRSTGAEDATSFLVGSFAGEHGEKLMFSGAGEVTKRVMQNLSSVTGSYSLLQSADGAVILSLDIAGAEKLYAFSLASPEGQFTIRDADGNTETFTPVL